MTNKPTTRRVIVKVQLPLASSGGKGGVLVYNKSRSFMQELPLRSRRELKELQSAIGDEMKGYFYAIYDGKGLILTDVAPWQSW